PPSVDHGKGRILEWRGCPYVTAVAATPGGAAPAVLYALPVGIRRARPARRVRRAETAAGTEGHDDFVGRILDGPFTQPPLGAAALLGRPVDVGRQALRAGIGRHPAVRSGPRAQRRKDLATHLRQGPVLGEATIATQATDVIVAAEGDVVRAGLVAHDDRAQE